MVLEVPVLEMLSLSPSMATREAEAETSLPPGTRRGTTGAPESTGGGEEEEKGNALKDEVISRLKADLGLAGEIRLMTVPTEWRAEPARECFRGALSPIPVGVGVDVDNEDSAERELAEAGVWVWGDNSGCGLVETSAQSGSIMGSRCSWEKDKMSKGELSNYNCLVNLVAFTSFLVFLNLKVFLLCAFCLCNFDDLLSAAADADAGAVMGGSLICWDVDGSDVSPLSLATAAAITCAPGSDVTKEWTIGKELITVQHYIIKHSKDISYPTFYSRAACLASWRGRESAPSSFCTTLAPTRPFCIGGLEELKGTFGYTGLVRKESLGWSHLAIPSYARQRSSSSAWSCPSLKAASLKGSKFN
jgi:hypothetical protein